jgi:alpha-N-arabinofuranosidase
MAEQARIDIDLERTRGRVDQRIFGGFIEHLGRCIYGGVYEPGSPRSDDRGFRRDVLDAARGLRVQVLRWPGGNFVSGYHWTDGVGPVDRRPRRLDIAWHAEEPNTFGTDEFIAYCRELGAEPYICLNMGTGTIDEARAWVEYCNGSGDTYWAGLRRSHGHAEPYRVRYWGLGNEMYGDWQIGSLTAEEYVAEARRWVNALRRTDPGIELVSCGKDGCSEWDRIVIDGLVRHVDYHSIHSYTGSAHYWSNVLAPHQAERALRTCSSLIDRARYLQRVERQVGIAYDEWNVWYRERDERSGLEERYTLADALAVGTYLNVFVRECAALRMANLAQLVNAIAPIVTKPDGLLLQSIYHPVRLSASYVREVALDPLVRCGTVSEGDLAAPPLPHWAGDLGPFALLDVAATRDPASTALTVTVVNRALEAMPVLFEVRRLAPAGTVVWHLVHGESPDATNTFEAPGRVSVTTRTLAAEATRFEVTLPPYSYSCLEVPLSRAVGAA